MLDRGGLAMSPPGSPLQNSVQVDAAYGPDARPEPQRRGWYPPEAPSAANAAVVLDRGVPPRPGLCQPPIDNSDRTDSVGQKRWLWPSSWLGEQFPCGSLSRSQFDWQICDCSSLCSFFPIWDLRPQLLFQDDQRVLARNTRLPCCPSRYSVRHISIRNLVAASV